MDMEDYLEKDNEVMEEKQIEYTPPDTQTDDLQLFQENTITNFMEST